MSARTTSNLENLRGSSGPHSSTSQRKITSEETVTPSEPTTLPPRNQDVSRKWDYDVTLLPLICSPIQTSNKLALEYKGYEKYVEIKP